MKTFLKPLTSAQESLMLKKCKAGDINARNMLVEHNLRLVAHIAKKYANTENDPEDMISIGTIGLIKAVDSFDIDKNIRLATYASRCIENEILMMLRSEKKRSGDIYMQEPIGTDSEGNEISLMDILSSEEDSPLKQMIDRESVQNLMKAAVSGLDPREKMILEKRYGIRFEKNKKDGTCYMIKRKAMTQKQIASELGISRSYVSRIEKRAVEKLRSYF